MAHTKACHGTHQGPEANLGFEAWEHKWHGPKKNLALVLACHGTGQNKNLCAVDSFCHAMAHTKACHGTHQGPGANLGFEAWETFQMSYNELINTLWANGTGQKKICAASTRFGQPWHTPRHAMAPTKACHATHQGRPWHSPRHAKTPSKASHGKPWHPPRQAMAPTKASHGTHQGKAIAWVCGQTCRAGPLTSACSATNLSL
jgi:hypothetical protein